MNIRFISSLTADDENAFAKAILRACSSLLDLLPISYAIHIETSDHKNYQHTRPGPDAMTPSAPASQLTIVARSARKSGT